MSGIVSRTVFVDAKKGYFTPHDFNMVVTELGMMLEPNSGLFLRKATESAFSTYDATDMISRVDSIEHFSMGRKMNLFTDQVVHGGTLNPREGY